MLVDQLAVPPVRFLDLAGKLLRNRQLKEDLGDIFGIGVGFDKILQFFEPPRLHVLSFVTVGFLKFSTVLCQQPTI